MNLKHVPPSAPAMLDSEEGQVRELKEMIGKNWDDKKMINQNNNNNLNNQNNNYDDDNNDNTITNKKIQRRMYQ